MYDLTAFKVDVILFVADEECMNQLHSYAEIRFHGFNDDYRKYIATIDSEKIRKEYSATKRITSTLNADRSDISIYLGITCIYARYRYKQ